MRDTAATRERQLGWYKEDTDFFTALRKKKKKSSSVAQLLGEKMGTTIHRYEMRT